MRVFISKEEYMQDKTVMASYNLHKTGDAVTGKRLATSSILLGWFDSIADITVPYQRACA